MAHLERRALWVPEVGRARDLRRSKIQPQGIVRGFPADLGELGPLFLGGGAVLAGAAFEAAPAWPVTATEPPISYRDQSASHGA